MTLRRENNVLKNELAAHKKSALHWREKHSTLSKKYRILKKKFQRSSLKITELEEMLSGVKKALKGSGTVDKQKQFQELSNLPYVNKTRVRVKYQVVSKRFRHPKFVLQQKKIARDLAMREVVNFYLSEENSCQAPGSHVTITKKKVKKQKHYLCDTIDNLYQKYRKKTVPNPVCRALFYSLKPFWVVKQNVNCRDTCLCRDHTNFQFLVDKLHVLKILKTNRVDEIMKMVCCETIDRKCVLRICAICKERSVMYSDDLAARMQEPTWYQYWLTKRLERPGANGKIWSVVKTERQRIVCKIADLVKNFEESFPKFFLHHWTTVHQFNEIKWIKENLQEKEVLLVVDFSQNYTAKYNKEIHSTHFGASKKEISLHTGGFYYRDEQGKLAVKTFATVSENLDHHAAAIWAHLQPIWKIIKETVPGIEILNVQSDGPTSQYKNKSNFFFIQCFAEKWGLKNLTWNFTSAGHGKSIADAAGANVKGLSDRAVACGQDVLGAMDFVNLVNSRSKVTALIVEESDILQVNELLTKAGKLEPVPGTMGVHQVIWIAGKTNELFFRTSSCHLCSHQADCTHYGMPRSDQNYAVSSSDTKPAEKEIKKFNIGDWIIVRNNPWYPGKIIKIENSKFVIEFLVRDGDNFVRPKTAGIQTIEQKKIVCSIEPPREIQRRRSKKQVYSLTIDQTKHILKLLGNCRVSRKV